MHEPSPWEGVRWWPVLKASRGGKVLLVFPSDPVPGGVGTCWFLGALKLLEFCESSTVRAPRKELPNPEDVPAGKQGDPGAEGTGWDASGPPAAPEIALGFADPARREGDL